MAPVNDDPTDQKSTESRLWSQLRRHSFMDIQATRDGLSVNRISPLDMNKRRVSEYVVSNANNERSVDEWQIEPMDEQFEFFEKGRDLQSKKTKHHFSAEEKEILGTYESAALKPSHTEVYKHWLSRLPARSDSESWVLISLIAVIIGVIAFFLKLITERLQIFHNPFIKDFVDRGQTFRLWLYMTGMSCTLGTLSVLTVVYICPTAAGSGVPEIIGILNGCVVRNVLGVRTLVCKIVSCIFTVISGLPVGFEGPMIHIGAMVGATMARPIHCSSCQDTVYTEQPPKEKKKGYCKKYFRKICRYRDCQERHNIIICGTAAGVASAFSSPITGLVFAMEELASHWYWKLFLKTNTLTWQTFVCCILARSTTELLHSVVGTLEHLDTHTEREINIFALSESALFDMKVVLQLSMSVFFPTVIIGILGGFLGSLYIFMHLKMARYRRRQLKKIQTKEILNAVKVVEVVILCFICSTLVMASMPLFSCNRVNHTEEVTSEIESKHMILRTFKCNVPLSEKYDGDDTIVIHEGYFHEGATLLFGSWEQMIRNLFTRRTPDFFGLTSLLLIFIFFFIFSSWAAMTCIASGLLVPQLAMGALFGRLLGKCGHDIIRLFMKPDDDAAKWDFTDPGALALLGAASFFAGSSRMPISSVVLMAEMTNDINMSLLVMVCVMLAKFIGDLFTHSLTHSLLEFKCIPHLDSELRVDYKRKRVDLELYSVSDIMSTPVLTAQTRSSIHDLANLLLDSRHGAFPVVKTRRGLGMTFMGLITRMELTILLTKTETFDINELKKEDIDKIRISYPEYSSNKLKDSAVTNRILEVYSSDYRYSRLFVNLLPYINLSSQTVSTRFSLQRAYTMFRGLGLRHLVVVDEFNQVQGMITRKDLMGFAVEEKIHKAMRTAKFRSKQKKREELEAQKSLSVELPKTINLTQNDPGLLGLPYNAQSFRHSLLK